MTNLKRIFLLQKRLVRAFTNADFYAHTAPLFRQLKILDIYKINYFYIAKFMFSYHHHFRYHFLIYLLLVKKSMINTRNAKSHRSHACRTNIKQFTILYRGPKIWNSLPTDIINTETIICFRSRMLNFLHLSQ